jgi:vesicle-associated membrane protein 7
MTGIIYTLISSETSATPLGEVALASGNFHMMALKILEKIKHDTNSSKSFSYEKDYIFHFHNKSGLVILCMTSSSFSNRQAYQFMFDLRDKLFENYGEQLTQAIGFAIKKHMIEEVKQMMIDYSSNEDKIAVVNRNINEVKDIMVQNIEKIIARGEKIEILVSKSEELEVNARVFKKKANSVKLHFCCKNIKITLIVIFILITIIGLVVVLSCGGFDFEKCR